eukprot:gene2647-1645_t
MLLLTGKPGVSLLARCIVVHCLLFVFDLQPPSICFAGERFIVSVLDAYNGIYFGGLVVGIVYRVLLIECVLGLVDAVWTALQLQFVTLFVSGVFKAWSCGFAEFISCYDLLDDFDLLLYKLLFVRFDRLFFDVMTYCGGIVVTRLACLRWFGCFITVVLACTAGNGVDLLVGWLKRGKLLKRAVFGASMREFGFAVGAVTITVAMVDGQFLLIYLVGD